MANTNDVLYSRFAVALHEEGMDTHSARSDYSSHHFPELVDALIEDFDDLVDETDFFNFEGDEPFHDILLT